MCCWFEKKGQRLVNCRPYFTCFLESLLMVAVNLWNFLEFNNQQSGFTKLVTSAKLLRTSSAQSLWFLSSREIF